MYNHGRNCPKKQKTKEEIVINNHSNLEKFTDSQLVEMAQKGDQDAKEVLYLRYKGFLVNESKKLVRNCGLNFDDTYGSLTYLFLCAINTYKHQGQFVGYMASYVRNKIKDDIGKRRGRMPYVPRNAPFYLRNMDERLLGDVDD